MPSRGYSWNFQEVSYKFEEFPSPKVPFFKDSGHCPKILDYTLTRQRTDSSALLAMPRLCFFKSGSFAINK